MAGQTLRAAHGGMASQTEGPVELGEEDLAESDEARRQGEEWQCREKQHALV